MAELHVLERDRGGHIGSVTDGPFPQFEWLVGEFEGQFPGELTLEFTNKPFELRKWTIRDAADVTTTVTLQNMKFGHSYENKFFAKSEYPEEK